MTISVIYEDTIIDPLVTSVNWSGDITQAYRKLDIAIKNTIDGNSQALTVELGKQLLLLSDNVEIFRGVIFSHSVNAGGSMQITAYDEAVYLTKSIDTRKFTNMKASAIVRELCDDFGIDIGDITDTGYVIPKLVLRDMSLWDMITTALTETRKQTGRRFWVQSANGLLNVIERGEKVVGFILDDSTNILDASYALSIEDMRNQIRVMGGDEEKKPIEFTVKDEAVIKKFGIMQHLERADSDLTRSQLEQLAKTLLEAKSVINDDANVTALGDASVTSGVAVYVREALTNIVGAFYVVTDSHSWEGDTYKMTLGISGDEELPQLQYEPPVVKAKSSDAYKFTGALAFLN
ncbi:hypothetical protein LOZ80_14900 [Paenibacillus sp. HWE-109]|uniref:XkdQ/YqbQ family protein n=1 Tax=Paenibacillus sp. HWE-109 TaxID=1306526 RepID=UPI001EE0AD42|nr:hypothetical protein [Paenibacillus sp. HWE-109]UKS30149.1 hypothetical protein LOZ80_14900 [Paenibacillus sp. HWE-109]